MKRFSVQFILLVVALLFCVGNASAQPVTGQMVEFFDGPMTMLLLGAGLVSFASYSRRGRKK